MIPCAAVVAASPVTAASSFAGFSSPFAVEEAPA